MKLIDYRGLNCYLNCLVTVAAHLGVEYKPAFSSLWSETEFTLDKRSGVYFTARLEDGLSRQGVKTEKLACRTEAEEAAAASLSALPRGGLAVIGMDMYDVPWSPLYKNVNGPHHFIAQKGAVGFTCHDPTYGLSERLTYVHMCGHAYEMRRIMRCAPQTVRAGLHTEAENVLRTLPALKTKLLDAVTQAAGEGRRRALTAGRYADALLNNRYLYKRYLSEAYQAAAELFDDSLFARWEGIKFGLLKASVVKNNAAVLDEVRGVLDLVTDAERDIARKILSTVN